MANYQCHRYHLVFSTKNREHVILPSIEKEVWAFIAATGREKGLKMFEVGGVEDHIHILCGIPASMTVSVAVQELKGASSRWMKQRFENSELGWQSGYGSFTSCATFHQKTRRYIQNQREHHKRVSFDDEMKAIIHLHESLA